MTTDILEIKEKSKINGWLVLKTLIIKENCDKKSSDYYECLSNNMDNGKLKIVFIPDSEGKYSFVFISLIGPSIKAFCLIKASNSFSLNENAEIITEKVRIYDNRLRPKRTIYKGYAKIRKLKISNLLKLKDVQIMNKEMLK